MVSLPKASRAATRTVADVPPPTVSLGAAIMPVQIDVENVGADQLHAHMNVMMAARVQPQACIGGTCARPPRLSMGGFIGL